MYDQSTISDLLAGDASTSLRFTFQYLHRFNYHILELYKGNGF